MTSAVNLKFLSLWLQARLGTSNSKPHQNHNVASVPLILKFAAEVPRMLANFGIGTLVSVGNEFQQRAVGIVKINAGTRAASAEALHRTGMDWNAAAIQMGDRIGNG